LGCMPESILRVRIPGLDLVHPVMNASGILGYEPEHIDRMYRWGLSAIVTKTITPSPRRGYETPIIIELPSGGFLNAVGLANPGKERIPDIVSACRRIGLPVVVSIGGTSEDEFLDVASVAEESGANAVELNLSCPHTKGYGMDIGSDPSNVRSVVKSVAQSLKIPVYAKLGLSNNVVKSSEKALEAGAAGLTLINTVKAMYVDVHSLKPVLTNVVGGLSGPPIHPIAVRVVYEVYRELKPVIIGVGGIYDWRSAAELIAVGASALQIGSMLALKGKEIVAEVLRGLERWVREKGAKNISELVGAALRS